MYNKLIRSSVDPNTLSLTVKGVLTAIIPVIFIVTGWTQVEVDTFIEMIVNIIFYVASIASAVLTILGLVRKAINGRWAARGSQPIDRMRE